MEKMIPEMSIEIRPGIFQLAYNDGDTGYVKT